MHDSGLVGCLLAGGGGGGGGGGEEGMGVCMIVGGGLAASQGPQQQLQCHRGNADDAHREQATPTHRVIRLCIYAW